MSDEEIESMMFGVVENVLGVDRSELTRGTKFLDDLSADSLDTCELIMETEEEFGLSISDDQAHRIVTIGDAIALVKRLLV